MVSKACTSSTGQQHVLQLLTCTEYDFANHEYRSNSTTNKMKQTTMCCAHNRTLFCVQGMQKDHMQKDHGMLHALQTQSYSYSSETGMYA